jgi:protease I
MPRAVFVIAPSDFRDEEYFEPKEILEEGGIETKTASFKKGEIIGVGGGRAIAEIEVSQIKSDEFDAIIFVGGPGMMQLTDNDDLISLAKDFYSKGKIVSAICVAPEILANAGILKGISATAWQGSLQKLLEKGAQVVDKSVCWSGKIITAQGPHAAREFGETLFKALA